MTGSICDLKTGETARDAMNLMAATVTASMNTAQFVGGMTVVYRVDHFNYAIAWVRNPSKVVPHYWPSFQEVVSALCARERSAAKQQMLATMQMEQYFDRITLTLPPSKLDAQGALRDLREQSNAMDALSARVSKGRVSKLEFIESVSDIAVKFGEIALYLYGLDKSMESIPCISESFRLCRSMPLLVGRFSTSNGAGDLQRIWDTLTTVRAALWSIMRGYATVTDNESIPSFILLRLLIGFRVELDRPDDKTYATIASALLTSLLYNKQSWLLALLQKMIVNIAEALAGSDQRTKVCFFLKGGRGIAYLLGAPETGENDWDTQILIEPSLSPAEWDATYLAVRDIVNNQLLRSSFVFSANLMNNASTLIASTKAVAEAAAKDPGATDRLLVDEFLIRSQGYTDEEALLDDPEFAMETVWQQVTQKAESNCKAELIDVGLPRYYTIELLEQWLHARSTVASRSGVPVPAAGYFIAELIMMVRESDAGVSPSPVKRQKRLKRLLNLLMPSTPGLEALLADATRRAARAPRTLQQIQAIRQVQIENLMTVLLGQFAVAYRLEADPNLAAAFDSYALRTLPAMPVVAEPAEIEDQANSAFVWCQTVSDTMTRHLADRGRFVLARKEAIFGLLAAGAAGQPIVPVFEDNFAICLHKQLYGSIRCGVAPAPFAFARLLFQTCASTTEITSQMLGAVVVGIQKFIAGQGSSPVFAAISATGVFKVFSAVTIPLATESYAPLLVEMVPAAASDMPTLTLPRATLCGLELLTDWCRWRASNVNEWATHRGLAETFGALIEMEASPLPSGPVWKSAL